MPKLALVEWVDSNSRSGWMNKDDIQLCNPLPCVSVGMMIETNDCVKVIENIGGNDVNMVMAIPKSCIKRLRYLRIVKEK